MSGLQDMAPPEREKWLTDALHITSMSSDAEIKELKLHLLKYGGHNDECPPSGTTITGCDCGWRQVVASVWPRR